MASQNETCIDKVQGEDYCTVYTTEPKYISKLLEIKEKNPRLVTIDRYIGSGEDRCIQAKVPVNWFQFVKAPRTMNLTDEQRKERAERMKKAREAKGKK